ncbi:hypothetical protein C5167_019015 [Papaver somniferum]|uniref:F-box domain-containing protein n=1 Tax=Papaver somniferum TaxID=3469 RepID=A0A4Y7IS95_PAPSO|nr:hypothetical protein C5167_019015 [Papaver somniferum]
MENSLGGSRLSKKPRTSDSRHQSTRDCVVAKYLFDHLIYEILLRTPAESLLKFKIVCKAWYLLIKDQTRIDYGDENKFNVTILNKLWEPENVSCNPERQTEELELTVPRIGS